MDEGQQKEQFSNAYLRAVVATAGYNVYKPEVDDDSVDWGIGTRGGIGTIRSPRVELQLKCTSQEVIKEMHLAYPLKLKNYDDLRFDDYQVPRILLVIIVPENLGEWLTQSEEQMTLRRCGYWLSLRGQLEVPNISSVTVYVPRAQMFNVAQLQEMMQRIANGGGP